MGVNFSRAGGTELMPSTHCSSGGNGSASDNIRDNMDKEDVNNEEFFETQDEPVPRSHDEEMIEFKKDLAIKREQRRTIIAKHTKEKENLRNSLELQIKTNETINDENKMLRELLQEHNITVPSSSTSNTEISVLKGPIAVLFEDLERFKSQNKKLRLDLTETNVSLQSANSDIVNMQNQNMEAMKQISALKEVVAVTKTMMKIRETQLIELKAKLSEIEISLADREASLLSTDLRAEYERQLQNIRTLRTLYEERARLAEVTRLQLLKELEDQKALTTEETNKCQQLNDKVAELEAKISEMSDTIDSKDDQISVIKEETRGLKAEMSAVNKLFSQMLLGYKSQQDLDTLVTRLEEHHGLLSHMAAREGGSENSALPKLLLDLLSQVDQSDGSQYGPKQPEKENSLSTTAEEIVENLPKVWRVLMELLSHQSGAGEAAATAAATPATCYKSVDTPTGTRMVPSVSQTYIRLKDLIVEKLSLTKEMSKMKQLNSHLETRLEQQERRLCLVTTELSKTWHVVGRLRRHHHQLHTHEKILRYELQQKRKMLNELKEELEFCREKWDKAKEKNTESEKEWKKLRTEFSSRKSKAIINNSGESGYSDERQTEDDSTESTDESELLNDHPLRCKKWPKKNAEVLPESITDPNLPAEREDPISDMLDVAELPLDGIDMEENVDKTCDSLKDDDDDLSVSDSCASDIFANSQCSLASETSVQSNHAPSTSMLVDDSSKKDSKIQDSSGISSENLPATAGSSTQSNCQETMNSIKKQYERLAKKDSRLESLEEASASLLKQVTKTATLRKDIDQRLQKLHNRATNENTVNEPNIKAENISPTNENSGEKYVTLTNSGTIEKTHAPINESSETDVELKTMTNNTLIEPDKRNDNLTLINPSEIMENVRKQNEHLAKREQRMKGLEEGYSNLLKTSRTTLQIGAELENRLDDLHSARTSKNLSTLENDGILSAESSNSNYINDLSDATSKRDGEVCTSNENLIEETISEPSTSSEPIDHEARFAARDKRLKRLEEQTKSLVNKVNDTATKSVRITYKLEELHNIYGSEGSTSRNQSSSDDETEEPCEERSKDP